MSRSACASGTPVLLLCTALCTIVAARAGTGPSSLAARVAGRVPETPEIRFRDVTATAGISVTNVSGSAAKPHIVDTIGSGAGWLDYDRDGDLDLYVTNGAPVEQAGDGRLEIGPGEPNALYRNLGGGRFSAVEAGVGDTGWAGGCAVADVDNDGFPDLFISNHGDNVLYRNLGDGTFEKLDQGPAGDLSVDPGWSTSAAFADLDADGFVDLFVAQYVYFDFEDPPAPGSSADCMFLGVPVMCGPRGLPLATDRLYRNQSGRFVAWQAESLAAAPAYGLGVVPIDVEPDGDIDVYVANDSVPNQLWRNDGTGTLSEGGLAAGLALSGDGQEQAGMGVDAGDVDGDGDPDLFVTNFSHDFNTLYLSVGRGLFLDRSIASGVGAASLPMLGWATNFIDAEGDGDLDLFVVNGHVYPEVDRHGLGSTYRQPVQLFVNDGAGYFEARELMLDGASAPTWSGRGAAFGDYDNDGDTDLFLVNIDEPGVLLENLGSPEHWIGLVLTGTTSNRDAIGARITAALPDGNVLVRWVKTAGGYLSAHDPRVLIGLGTHERVDELEVVWPSGARQRLGSVTADRWVRVVEEG